MRKASFGRVLWGLGLLAAAAFLVLDQLHLIPVELGFWTIFWTVVFAATLITSLINRSLGGTIFSIAFLLIIYAKPLHIESIVPWTVLLAAFLVWGGLRLIFKKSWKPTVIINGEKKQGLGGGNCQISSTLYNAVLSVPNLTVVERHEHGREVHYVPEGKDAAVSYGSVDFKFKNETGNDIKLYFSTDNITLSATIVKLI